MADEELFRDPMPRMREEFLERLRRDRALASQREATRKGLRGSGVIVNDPDRVFFCVALDTGDDVEFRELMREDRVLFRVRKDLVTRIAEARLPIPGPLMRFLVAVSHSGILRRYKRRLIRLTLGEGAKALHTFFEVPESASVARFVALFANRPSGQCTHSGASGLVPVPDTAITGTHLPADGPSDLKDLLPSTWAVIEGELPPEEDDDQVPLPAEEFLVALDQLAAWRQRGEMTNEEFRAAKVELIAQRRQARIRANSLLLR